jgi:hypothetical protein
MTTNDNNRPPTANEITAELLLRLQREMPRVWLYRNNRLDADVPMSGGRKRHVSAGINGQGDLSGIIGAHPDCICREHPPIFGETFTCPAPTHLRGVRIEAEVKADWKSGRDRQSPVQEAFEAKVLSMGAVYTLVDRIGWLNGKPDLSGVLVRLRELIG